MTFSDLGRMVLEATVTASLGERAAEYDVPSLVNAYVEKFGFVDIDEVGQEEYGDLVARFDQSRTKAESERGENRED